MDGDTIYALASGAGRAGVAVVRVSGPRSWKSLKALTNKQILPRHALFARLVNPQSKTLIDEAVVLPFQAPASYTGEDVVEYHIHGGRAVLSDLLDFLGAQDAHRMAEPGEFTRRAFENGKMDLTAAEAVADLIDAETSAQKIQALSQMGGALSRLYEGWSEDLKRALAHLEADIEFPDEDLPDGVAPEVMEEIQRLQGEISLHLNDGRRGERLRDGIQIAVIGAPNAGKSSLVNALARRDVAIVSDLAGTTRDVIEVHLDLGGFPVVLADTAGLRPEQLGESGHDAIESEGIRRALERAENADIRLLVFDGTAAQVDAHTFALRDVHAIALINKADHAIGLSIPDALEVSATTGEGLDALLEVLRGKVAELIGAREMPSLTRRRHRSALEEALACLQRSRQVALPELIAEDMRLAVRALGRITGRVDVEDLLDVIFRDFCIGK